jgi:hypothetical protein
VLGKIGKENSEIESNVFGRIMKSFRKFNVVNFPVVIRIAAHQEKVDFLPENNLHPLTSHIFSQTKRRLRSIILELLHFFLEFFRGNPSIFVYIHFLHTISRINFNVQLNFQSRRVKRQRKNEPGRMWKKSNPSTSKTYQNSGE